MLNYLEDLHHTVPSPEQELFRYIDDEESLTDFFVSLLDHADTQRVLNAIHEDDPIKFDDSSRISETQRNRLPQPPEMNESWILDWVIEDGSKIVGYESKRQQDLYGKQLRKEREKLQYYANGKEVYLFAITEDIYDPDVKAEYTWKSWYEVGKSIIELEEESKILKLLSNMVKSQEFDGFTGFSCFEREESWMVTHQNEAVNLAVEVERQTNEFDLYEKVDHHNRKKRSLRSIIKKDSRGLAPPFYEFSFYPTEYNREEAADDGVWGYDITNEGWDIQLIVPSLHNQIYVQLNTYPRKDDDLKKILQENAAGLTEILMRHNGMYLESSWNSLIRDPNPSDHRERSEIMDVLKNKSGRESWRRLRFGWKIDGDKPPEIIIDEIHEKMSILNDIFYEDRARRRTNFSSPDSA